MQPNAQTNSSLQHFKFGYLGVSGCSPSPHDLWVYNVEASNAQLHVLLDLSLSETVLTVLVKIDPFHSTDLIATFAIYKVLSHREIPITC